MGVFELYHPLALEGANISDRKYPLPRPAGRGAGRAYPARLIRDDRIGGVVVRLYARECPSLSYFTACVGWGGRFGGSWTLPTDFWSG